ncbi:MAG: glucose-1-phosphate adenylyltransferase [Syntrophobacterales bacterium]|nr:MAG: glucose-1-phosphate adenylyltransferase [Syntrophobacterales bacterium]
MAMKKVLAMILAGGKGERLYPLTKDRTKPAVPFGGIYRIIDFTLSNCVNSNIRRIYVLTQYKSISLDRHIRLGWNLFSSQLGEFISPIPAQQRLDESWYKGTADAIFQNFYTLQQERPDLTLILSGDHIYKMDYNEMIRYHMAKEADLTVGTIQMPSSTSREFGVIEVDREYQVVGFQEKPEHPRTLPGNPEAILASMGIYVFNTEILVRRLIQDAKRKGSSHDFGRDVIPSMFTSDRVYAFSFWDEERVEPKYWRDVGTMDAYFDATMDLVSVIPQFNLYDFQWPIHTYYEPFPPAKTVHSEVGRTGVAINSILSGGCIVSGGRVENSILSPNVQIHSYAEVTDSIIMEGVSVGRNARIRRSIIDKGITVPEGMEIGFDLDKDRKKFTVADTNIVVVPKGMRL